MRRTALSAAVLLLAARGAAAEPPEVTPVPAPEAAKWAEMRVAADDLVTLSAQPASAWELVDEASGKLRTFDNGKYGVLLLPAGRHRLTVTAPDGARTRLVLVAGDAPAPAPPGPKPPAPPVPKPDPLVADLRAAFLADRGQAADMQALSALYTLMVRECVKPEYATASALNAVFVRARDEMLKGPGADDPVRLPAVRVRCGAEVVAVVGTDPDAAITDETRGKLRAVYTKLAKAVAEAGK